MSFDKIARKPRFEKSNMYGTVNDCQKLYDEVVQWNRSCEDDKSPLRGIVYGMGYNMSELAYHGYSGERLNRELSAMRAVVSAVECLQNVLEDVLGIESVEYDDCLNKDGYGRYKLIDTYKDGEQL